MEPPDPRLQINREELAWAAGFFDGEGWTGLRGRALGMVLPQTDPRPLQRFQVAVLGLGTIDGPWQPRNPKWKPKWTWRIQRFETVQAVAAMLWAFLSEPKREQARRALMGYAVRPHIGTPICKHGHNNWTIRPDGRRDCLTCYRHVHPGINRQSLCSRNHDNWKLNPNGRRYCATCWEIYELARRGPKAAYERARREAKRQER